MNILTFLNISIRLSVDIDLEVISSTKTGTWTHLVLLSIQLMSQCSAGTSRKKIKCIGNYNIGRTFEPRCAIFIRTVDRPSGRSRIFIWKGD